jgi:hypothetical protein
MSSTLFGMGMLSLSAQNRYHALEFDVDTGSLAASQVNYIELTDDKENITGYLFIPEDESEIDVKVKLPTDGLLAGSGNSAVGIVAVKGDFDNFNFRSLSWPAHDPSSVWSLSEDLQDISQITLTAAVPAPGSVSWEDADNLLFELNLAGDGAITTYDWSSHQRAQAEKAGDKISKMFSMPDGVGKVQDADNPYAIKFQLLMVDLVPDWDRDGVINDSDRNQATEEEPFRFWVNDDDDDGFVSRNGGMDDVPGSQEPDWQSQGVDGVRDLVDFFPLWFDIKSILEAMPTSDFDYFIKHEDSGFNFILTDNLQAEGDLAADKANAYLRVPSVAEDIADSELIEIEDGEAQIPSQWLDAIAASSDTDSLGVILFEARAIPESETINDSPIVFGVKRKGTADFIELKRFPISISSVERMFARKNLVEEVREIYNDTSSSPKVAEDSLAGDQYLTEEPENYPDTLTNDKAFIFAHGCCTEQTAGRGVQSEVFKRMYWSGSRAKFYGISWNGYSTKFAGRDADYWEDVTQAFVSAAPFADFVNGPEVRASEKVLVAHSLGNVLSTSAIVDFGMSVDVYNLLDAAIAMEAFDAAAPGSLAPTSATIGTTTGNTGTDAIQWKVVGHEDWDEYVEDENTRHEGLWASDWHDLFPADDARSDLTWEGRFTGLLSSGIEIVNYYSSGEETLENANFDGSVPSISLLAGVFGSTAGVWSGRQAFVAQEMNKGNGAMDIFTNWDSHAGWDFNEDRDDLEITGFPNNSALKPYRKRYPSEIDGFTMEWRRIYGFFGHFKPSDSSDTDYDSTLLYDAQTGAGSVGSVQASRFLTRAKLLAEAIPALTNPVGGNEVSAFADFGHENINLMSMRTDDGSDWPNSKGIELFQNRWLHSDFRDVAYQYNYKLYDEWTSENGLRD